MTAPVATEEKPAERPVAGDAATATPVQPEIGGGDSAAGGLTGPPGALMRTGLIASLSVHLLVVAVVAASFLASGAPKQTEVIPVELVPNEPVAEDKAPGAAGSEQAEPGSEPTPDKAVAPPEPDKAAPPAELDKPAPPPAAEQTSAEKKAPSPPADAADAFEPVTSYRRSPRFRSIPSAWRIAAATRR